MNETKDFTMTATSHWDRVFRESIKSAWTNNLLVQQAVNIRMTGQPKHWLNWVFEDYLSTRPEDILSIGCGDGSHELVIARNKYAKNIYAFDASKEGIERARDRARREELVISFDCDTFENFVKSNDRRLFDIILFSGSLHHVNDIEGMLTKVRERLKRGGRIIFNEYVGTCYNIYPKIQVDLLNEVLSHIPPRFKTSEDALWQNPTIEAVMATDPSESVRSSLILQFLEFYFDFELIRPFGGGLLHPIFDRLNCQKVNDGSAESEALVRMLIWFDEFLYTKGILRSDFAFGVCTPKS